MLRSERPVSRLALLSLASSLLWYVGAIAAFAIYWNPPNPAPQRWDRLVVLMVLFGAWIITGLLSAGTGVAALLQIRHSQGRTTGLPIAIGGIVLAVLPGVFLIWSLYG